MSFLRIISIGAILSIFTVGTVQAAYVSYDLYTKGDGFVTYDNTTNLEWLDLTQTTNMTYNGALEYYASSGWGHATKNQFDHLIDTIFPDFAPTQNGIMFTRSGTKSYDQIWYFQSLFGEVYSDRRWPSEEWASLGLYKGSDGNLKLGGANLYDYRYLDHTGYIYGDTQNNQNGERKHFNIGTYLVRTKISEPGSLLLLGLGLVVVTLFTRRRKKFK